MPLPVDAINAMTMRWVAALPSEATAFSSVGAWPLLAIVADAAGGRARDELGAAIGTDPSAGTADGLAVLGWLDETDGMSGALGVWHRADVPIRPDWNARMPAGVTAALTGDLVADQAALDRWATECTDGLIERMPAPLTPETVLLLASALTLRTTWLEPFEEAYGGPPLRRVTNDRSIVRATESVTCVRVEGDNGLDVHVVLGLPDAATAEVLAAGMRLVGEGAPAAATGPGMSAETVPSFSGEPEVVLVLPRFQVRADHDLLALPEVFGLATVTDSRRGHLPGISDVPLCVSAAEQTAVAEFSATGFKAAAVTAVGMRAAAMMRPTREAERTTVTIDRPFGFLAVHRATGLVLFAGWVTESRFGS